MIISGAKLSRVAGAHHIESALGNYAAPLRCHPANIAGRARKGKFALSAELSESKRHFSAKTRQFREKSQQVRTPSTGVNFVNFRPLTELKRYPSTSVNFVNFTNAARENWGRSYSDIGMTKMRAFSKHRTGFHGVFPGLLYPHNTNPATSWSNVKIYTSTAELSESKQHFSAETYRILENVLANPLPNPLLKAYRIPHA